VNSNTLRADLADFLARLGRLLSYGVPLTSALDVLIAEISIPQLRKLGLHMIKTIELGRPVSDSFRSAPLISPALANMLYVAEQKGQLDARLLDAAEAIRRGDISLGADENAEAPVDAKPDEEISAVSRMVDSLLTDAVRARASDIHIDPTRTGAVVRLRIDGTMHTQPGELTRGQYEAVVSRIKQMAALDPAERQLPQDGRIHIQLPQRPGDVDPPVISSRVSVCPYVLGEKVVIRILDARNFPADLSAIMPPEHIAVVKTWLESPFGLILVAGPTGSGKTTTLLLMTNTIACEQRLNVLSIEDPVEVLLPGVHQMQIRPAIGLTLPAALRSIMRQDPDVIVIGEIDSPETAKLAVGAAQTGHLILSQARAHDAAAVAKLLSDMGIPPYMLREICRGIIAQRLVRALCPKCKQQIADEERADAPEIYRSISAPLFKPIGCDACASTGFRGLRALYELFEPRPAFWNALAQGLPDDQLRATAQRHTLRDDGIRLLRNGDTCWQEIERVLLA